MNGVTKPSSALSLNDMREILFGLQKKVSTACQIVYDPHKTSTN